MLRTQVFLLFFWKGEVVDKQAVTRCNERIRLHSFNLGCVICAHSSTICGSDILNLAHTEWAQVNTQSHCSERANGQFLLSTRPKITES